MKLSSVCVGGYSSIPRAPPSFMHPSCNNLIVGRVVLGVGWQFVFHGKPVYCSPFCSARVVAWAREEPVNDIGIGQGATVLITPNSRSARHWRDLQEAFFIIFVS